MASWYSNLVQKTSSQISSLRQNLLSGDADGDTEDDTHVCRVLRGYYAEKGRPPPRLASPGSQGSPAAAAATHARQQPGRRREVRRPGSRAAARRRVEQPVG
ncbi:hypothetical protein NW754_014628 [Fusarium falciforme]|nr:hypothetical protein NW754_014628 [Fusarium falciforme]